MSSVEVELGIIEGYYGRPWSWQERENTLALLSERGYRRYLYAPKADVYLRRLWREEHPREAKDSIARLASRARSAGVHFGVGLSPSRLHDDPSAAAMDALARKLESLQELGIDEIALLFDDMKNLTPDLAERQARIVDFAATRLASVRRVFVCPSYYTDDPILDRVFGARPDAYLERLGKLIDPAHEIFWTGPEVCSREFTIGHLSRVAEQFGRKPFLWDNYPVNDGQRMSQYLHIRAFTGRAARIAPYIAGHGVNPALQPVLSRIPALTLVESYAKGDAYDYGAAFLNAAREVAGEELASVLYEDVLFLQELGLDRLGERESMLRERYARFDHPAAREVLAWLDGAYRITDEIVREQSGDD